MLEGMKFCYCFGVDQSPEKEKRCITFNFTDRALKILTKDFIFQITITTPKEDSLKTGIPIVNLPGHPKKVLLTQLDKNVYRISIIYLDSLIRCLFKYLPATYVEGETTTEYYPTCVTEKMIRESR